ncbi:hypothetical protein DPMN_179280 [Dreissena polymorpha]|uniref:Uncharacterized protein n=1 Tax=Dreissena polymorpha TaxID=45954 RepID=A0A9D4IM72_DREPO|nr:hypothetical protein DPMN_179280 [Dreissena polymorpha]
MMLRLLVASLCFVAAARSITAPAQCAHVTDAEFTCDYSAMDAGERPIDFTAFDPKPQQLHVTVNGIVPYIGDTQMFSSAFSGIDTATFDSNDPASLTLDCGWSGGIFLSSGAFANMSHVQHFSIRNCGLYNIPSEAFKELGNLDYFKIENGKIDEVNINAWMSLNVERLTSDSHAIPRNLGKIEISLHETFHYYFTHWSALQHEESYGGCSQRS